MSVPEWYTSLGFVTQMAHMFSGWATVLTVDLWAKKWWIPALVLQAWAIPKEFGWDILIERDSWGGSALDWSMYTLGSLIASLVIGWKKGRIQDWLDGPALPFEKKG